MRKRTVCILGGTGFVGQHLINRLGHSGWQVRVPTRRPERYRDLKLIQHLELQPVERLDADTLPRVFNGCDAVVNLIGILNQDGATSFQRVHVDLVQDIISAAQAAGVSRLVQMSALKADAVHGSSEYLRSKGAGEDLALAAEGLQVSSVRPSVIFGRGDGFFMRFGALLRLAPWLFPLACPDARFAPVWVGDVCSAIDKLLDDPVTIGKGYDLCGPRAFSLQDLVEKTAQWLGLHRKIIRMSDSASQWQAKTMERIPGKPFTMDNYRSLQTASVCSGQNGLIALGIKPTDVDTIVPTYLV
jgi:NADH dehydrogenase